MIFLGLKIAFQATTMSSHALNICLPNQRIMSKFYLSLVKSFHKKGLGVTILKSDLMLNNHTVGPSASQRTYGRFQDVLGTSAASSADQSLVLSCFYDLEMLEDPEVRCI